MIIKYLSNYFEMCNLPNREQYFHKPIQNIIKLPETFSSICYTIFVINLLTILTLLIIASNIAFIIFKSVNTDNKIVRLIFLVFIAIALLLVISSYITGSFLYFLSRSRLLWGIFLTIWIINNLFIIFLDRQNRIATIWSLFPIGIMIAMLAIRTDEELFYINVDSALQNLKKFINISEDNIKTLQTICKKVYFHSSLTNLYLHYIIEEISKNKNKGIFLTLLCIEFATELAYKIDTYKYDNNGKIIDNPVVQKNPSEVNHTTFFYTIINIFYNCLVSNFQKSSKIEDSTLNEFFKFKNNAQSYFFWKVLLYGGLSDIALNNPTKYQEFQTEFLDSQDKRYTIPIRKIKELYEFFELIPIKYKRFQILDFYTPVSQFCDFFSNDLDIEQTSIIEFFTELKKIMCESEIFNKYNLLDIYFRPCYYPITYKWSHTTSYGNHQTTTYHEEKSRYNYCFWSLELLLALAAFVEIEINKGNKSNNINDILNNVKGFNNFLIKKFGQNNKYLNFKKFNRKNPIDDNKFSVPTAD